MTENEKRFRIEFTVDAEGWSDKFIKDSAIQELNCMVPYPEDITFSEANPWHTGTPSDGGLFLVYLKDGTYDIYEFGKEYKAWDIGFSNVVAWQKIEHYKEKENG